MYATAGATRSSPMKTDTEWELQEPTSAGMEQIAAATESELSAKKAHDTAPMAKRLSLGENTEPIGVFGLGYLRRGSTSQCKIHDPNG